MIELSVTFGLYVIWSLYFFRYLVQHAADERKELEDRLMVLAKPDAAILHQAQRDPVPATVSYVDDEAMTSGNGHVELLEDD